MSAVLPFRAFKDRVKRLNAIERQSVEQAGPEMAAIALAGVAVAFAEQRSPDGTPWAPPGLKPGRLLSSVTAHFEAGNLILAATGPGANAHQYGATITPHAAKALTIPVSPEAKRAAGARSFGDRLFVIRSVGQDRGLLVERVGSRLVVHYLLRTSVTIPARPFLGVSKRTADRMGAVVARKYNLNLSKVLGVT